jgi:hypothetical protein
MNFGTLLKAFDAVMVLRDAAKRLRNDPPAPPAETGLATVQPQGLTGQIEARLTNVVVAALKEAFDRDHARLELERAQMEEQRRRAEEALRAELRRQALDRELGRLRLLAATALVGWIASVAVFVARLDVASTASRALAATAWLLLLGGLGAAFTAQGRLGRGTHESAAPAASDPLPAVALWLLVGGLAVSAIGLLF